MTNQPIAANARANADAQRRAARADVTTPLPVADLPADLPSVGAVPPAVAAAATGLPEQPAKSARTLTIQIAAVMEGFTIGVSFDGTFEQIPAAIARLKALGATQTASTPAAPNLIGWQTLPDGTPICTKHQIPMRLRERQGDKWHSHQMIDGNGHEVYCKGYKGKDSPGYDIE